MNTDLLSRLNAHFGDISGVADRWITDEGLDRTYIEGMLKCKGNCLIASCAGSGKTTALSLKVIHDLENSPNCSQWVGTFLRRGKQDLSKTIGNIMPAYRGNISTIHSEFYNRYIVLTGETPDIISESADLKLLEKVMNKRDINLGYSANVQTLLERWRASLGNFNDDSIHQYLGSVRPEVILDEWKALRLSRGKMSHGDIEDYLWSFLKDGGTLGVEYTHIYLDEFQDVSRIQYEILKKGYANCVKVVVGDDDQSIYSWRGSSPEIIQREVVRDWDCKVFVLPVNYRCPSNIVNLVAPMISKNTGRLEKELRSSQEGGEVILRKAPLNKLGSLMLEGVSKDVNEGKKVVILTRTNNDLVYPALLLSSLPWVFVSLNSNQSGTLTTFHGLFTFLGVSDETKGTSCANILRIMSGKSSTKFLSFCKQNCISVLQGLISVPLDSLSYSAPHLVPLARSCSKQDWSGDWTAEKVLSNFRSVFVDLGLGHSMAQQNLLSCVDCLLELVTPSDTLVSLAKRVLMSWENMQGFMGDADVELSTVHSYKGLESDSVYLWSATDGLFPSSQSSDIQEERRLFYIACTRARQKLTLLSWNERPSPFLEELCMEKKIVIPFN